MIWDHASRVALIAYHACPLASPGQGKAGGMNVHVRELARSMAQSGVVVDIFTREHDGQTADLADIPEGVSVIHLPAGPPDAPLGDQFTYLPHFVAGMHEHRAAHEADYRAVHSHYWLSGWAGLRFAAEIGAPHVVTFHTLSLIKMQSRSGEDEPPMRQVTEKEIIATTDGIVAFSPHERDAIVRLYGGEAGRVELVPCGVDLDRFQPLGRTAARDKLGINGHKVLLYVGRIEALKGVDLLLHTTAHLDADPGVQVLVVGSDAEGSGELERLRRLADDLHVGGNVEFVGRVPQEHLAWYYSAADVCVVPSFYESFGLAALESMACGTPVVASRVGGLSTIVEHGRTGYLKSWRCPESFAHSLEMIFRNRSLQNSLGLAARRRAEGMSWHQVAGKMLDLYDRLKTDQHGKSAAS